jgi:RNA polymerase sigma factor (sigma-70 family)
MDGQELLRSNLALVERLVRFVCRNAQVVGADVDDFASTVKLALIEDDYAVLRAWEGRSSIATYLTVVIQRLLADERFREHGRWRPSAEAKRIGDAGILLESLLRRDERSLAEAIPMVLAVHPTLTDVDVRAMAARLPERVQRPQLVEIRDDVPARDDAERRMLDDETRRSSEEASRVVRDAVASLPIKDRMLLRLRFAMGMSIADAARILQLPQRPLYRRLEQILAMLRDALRASGIDAGSAAELIGSTAAALDFGLAGVENGTSPPVHQGEVS